MCTSVFAFGVHPTLLFFLAFNRDEFFDRPTDKVSWWDDEPAILAGRDAVRRGTWLGMSRTGRFAFLTNFREVQHNNVLSGPSRGELTVNFLRGQQRPYDYLKELDLAGQNGFNLVVGNMTIGEVAYLTNRDPHSRSPVKLEKGVYSISNGLLSSTWPKTERARSQVQEVLKGKLEPGSFPMTHLQDSILGLCEKADDDKVPITGMPQEVEKDFSSIFIQPTKLQGKDYGTHTQTVVIGWANNEVEYHERALYPVGKNGGGNSDRHSLHRLKVPITEKWKSS